MEIIAVFFKKQNNSKVTIPGSRLYVMDICNCHNRFRNLHAHLVFVRDIYNYKVRVGQMSTLTQKTIAFNLFGDQKYQMLVQDHLFPSHWTKIREVYLSKTLGPLGLKIRIQRHVFFLDVFLHVYAPFPLCDGPLLLGRFPRIRGEKY